MERTGGIRFEELGIKRTFASSELQARANDNPLTDARKQYRVWLGDQEAAYLSFDVFWPEEINLYEIFVVSELRDHGIGSACIRFAVDLTKQLEKPRLTVRPKPLSGQSKDDLVAWYVRRGFTPMTDDPELLEIVIT